MYTVGPSRQNYVTQREIRTRLETKINNYYAQCDKHNDGYDGSDGDDDDDDAGNDSGW